MPKWSLIETGVKPAAFNMALDEALLIRHSEGACGSAVRLYGWSPPAVSIGYTQDWDADVNREECARLGVDVIRRITGGGAVFHDREITYSVVSPIKYFNGNIQESFRIVSEAIISGLAGLCLNAEFAPLNDIIVNGKKISGNAQARRKGSILQHGTILMGIDKELMFRLIKVPPEKIQKRRLARASDRVTCIHDELCREISFDESADALRAGFTNWLRGELESAEPSPDVISLADKLMKRKYLSVEWNRDRISPDF